MRADLRSYGRIWAPTRGQCPFIGGAMVVARRAATVRGSAPQIAGEREVVGSVRAAADPDRDDLSVALERHPVRHVSAPEVGRLPAVAGKARVERPVDVVAGQREVEVVSGAAD